MRASLLALIFSLSAHANQVVITNSNPGVGPMVVLGDSLASGWGTSEESVRPAGCLDASFEGEMHGMAIPGNTSKGVLNKLDEAIAKNPKLVFVSSGGNDAIRNRSGGAYPPERTYQEMAEIFDRLLATGAVVAYLGLNPPFEAAARLPVVSEIARAKGVLVIDGMNGMWGTDYMADLIHPNTKGYTEMCRRIVEAVRGHYP